jgi:hypothetical protein
VGARAETVFVSRRPPSQPSPSGGRRLSGEFGMIRWMIVIFLTLVFISALTPWLNKLGFGKLPGDLRFKLFGKERYIPLTTTIVLSLIASVISQII